MQCLQPQFNPLEKLYITAIQKRLKTSAQSNIKLMAELRPATLFMAGLINYCCRQSNRLFLPDTNYILKISTSPNRTFDSYTR